MKVLFEVITGILPALGECGSIRVQYFAYRTLVSMRARNAALKVALLHLLNPVGTARLIHFMFRFVSFELLSKLATYYLASRLQHSRGINRCFVKPSGLHETWNVSP